MKTTAKKEDRRLILTRDFDATVELMFDLWSNCKHLKQWWGPKEWPMDECEMDFREGGTWRYCLRGPGEGDESWGRAVYKEIKKPEKIMYNDHFTDAEGNINEEMPKPVMTIEFVSLNGKTRQITTMELANNEERDKIAQMGFVEGMNSSLDRIDEYLTGM